jgi:hypothetical protein
MEKESCYVPNVSVTTRHEIWAHSIRNRTRSTKAGPYGSLLLDNIARILGIILRFPASQMPISVINSQRLLYTYLLKGYAGSGHNSHSGCID